MVVGWFGQTAEWCTNRVEMAVQSGNLLTATTGMTIDQVSYIKYCVCLSGRAFYYVIVLSESRMTLNYHDYQLHRLRWASEFSADCSDGTWTTWVDKCDVILVERRQSRCTWRHECTSTKSDYDLRMTSWIDVKLGCKVRDDSKLQMGASERPKRR